VNRFHFAGWLAALLLVTLTLTPPDGLASRALAQSAPVDPRAVALTPADLPPGFAFLPEETKLESLADNYALRLSTQLGREPTPEHLQSGPVSVGQVIVRIDRMIVPADMLSEIRTMLVQNRGFSLVPDAPNDGGTASLQSSEGDVMVYAVGFVKNEMVIFTIAGGQTGVVTLPETLRLAGISSAKYDALPR
jgi:hypothetical protein